MDKTISANELKRAMRTLALRDTPANRQALYSLLLQAELILPTENAEPGEHVARENDSLRLIVMQDEDGKIVWPAFTDEQALVEWKQEGGASARLAARAVFAMLIKSEADRLIINPGGAVSGVVTRQEAHILADGAVPVPESAQAMRIHLQQEMRMTIASAKDPPHAAIQKIRDQLQKFDPIEQAFLFLGATDGSQPHFVLGIRLNKPIDEHAFASMSETIGRAAVAELDKDTYLDLLSVDDELLETLLQIMTPIYTREHA